YTPEVGAVCGKAARTDLCGGRGVTRVPTATRFEPSVDDPGCVKTPACLARVEQTSVIVESSCGVPAYRVRFGAEPPRRPSRPRRVRRRVARRQSCKRTCP